ncbi:MAG TPA: hypothetical protein V6D47_20595 [Oscillatoriaceae cyanobacterium]
MSTRPLVRSTGSRRLDASPQAFVTPLPPFHVLFPSPPRFDAKDPLYEAFRAANRAYRDRLRAYEAKARELNAPDLVAFIRDDVISNLLVTVRDGLLPSYRFLNAKRFRVWFPPHRRDAEAMVATFAKKFRRRRAL